MKNSSKAINPSAETVTIGLTRDPPGPEPIVPDDVVEESAREEAAEKVPEEPGGAASAHGPDPSGLQGTGNPMVDERSGCKPFPIE